MKVIRALRTTGAKDFWPLTGTVHLARETKDFVPQIQAAVLIGRDPGRYGFEVKDFEPSVMDRVAVPPSTVAVLWTVMAGVGPVLSPLRPHFSEPLSDSQPD